MRRQKWGMIKIFWSKLKFGRRWSFLKGCTEYHWNNVLLVMLQDELTLKQTAPFSVYWCAHNIYFYAYLCRKKLRSKWKQLYLGGTVGGKVLHIRVPHLWNEVSVIALSHSYFIKFNSKCGDYYLAGISHHLQEHHNLFMCTTNTDVTLLWSDKKQGSVGPHSHCSKQTLYLKNHCYKTIKDCAATSRAQSSKMVILVSVILFSSFKLPSEYCCAKAAVSRGCELSPNSHTLILHIV